MGAHSQRKGAGGERDFMKELMARLPSLSLTRNTYEQRVKSGHADVLGLPGFAIEVKRYGNSTTDWYKPDWWEQTVHSASLTNAIPLLGYRYNRKPWRVVVPWGFGDVTQPVVCDLDTVCERIRMKDAS